MLEAATNIDQLYRPGRILRVNFTQSGRCTFIIRGEGPALMKRGRFFAHEADQVEPKDVLRVGNLIEFLPSPPDRPGLLPRARMIKKLSQD
jgi:hypothetical protein